MEEERKVAAAPASEIEKSNVMKKEIPAKYIMRSHMDIVRGIQFVPELDAIASVSEDCTVKLWSFKNIDSNYAENDGNLDPYITLRGHTGPLFSVTGGHPKNKRVIFTAGSEGVIRVWNLPALNEVNQYGDTYDGRNYCIG
jgi:striatin 1/3/4